MTNRIIRPRRSFIFTPGLRPDMFPKALASGTDIVCVELEDGIEGDRETGAAAGALIGGAAGKEVTDSEPESNIAAVIGGLLGSAVGAEIGSNLTKKEGIEILIETNGGRMVSIIQEVGKYNFKVNQKVRIIKRNGKSRVIPFD